MVLFMNCIVFVLQSLPIVSVSFCVAKHKTYIRALHTIYVGITCILSESLFCHFKYKKLSMSNFSWFLAFPCFKVILFIFQINNQQKWYTMLIPRYWASFGSNHWLAIPLHNALRMWWKRKMVHKVWIFSFFAHFCAFNNDAISIPSDYSSLYFLHASVLFRNFSAFIFCDGACFLHL